MKWHNKPLPVAKTLLYKDVAGSSEQTHFVNEAECCDICAKPSDSFVCISRTVSPLSPSLIYRSVNTRPWLRIPSGRQSRGWWVDDLSHTAAAAQGEPPRAHKSASLTRRHPKGPTQNHYTSFLVCLSAREKEKCANAAEIRMENEQWGMFKKMCSNICNKAKTPMCLWPSILKITIKVCDYIMKLNFV